MTLTWRPLDLADADAWVRLKAAAEAVDQANEHFGPADYVDLVGPMDRPAQTLGVFDGADLAAYGVIYARRAITDLDLLRLLGGVAPTHRRRGLGRELLTRLAALALDLHATRAPGSPVQLLVPVHENNAGHAALATSEGYTPIRWFFDMRADLAVLPAQAAVPEGYLLEHYTPDFDDLWRDLRNDTFAEHWGSGPVDAEFWRAHYVGSEPFVAEHSAHLRDLATGELASFVLSQHYAADAVARGHRELWIADVGTRAAHRGRGLAGALLSHVMHAARAEGYATAGLSVDADNETGALGVYERAGFRVTDKWAQHSRVIGA
ncbi:GNAT family N-acetyltransferase [Actinokineospora sp. NBRC 105648]|uniref:GNAT family N-acetyltransferase n=1 Tax=Actinokineospora sp. NBRC 105648 TaxID=3032206 RepID=UPI00249FB971|nr:GNAT family N-acetyltransferase [Actinokineospora sp. NBRC 105648]GLZ40062.1 N-acetyltransferase [Actinokineospora sp. NBRC 105648]